MMISLDLALLSCRLLRVAHLLTWSISWGMAGAASAPTSSMISSAYLFKRLRGLTGRRSLELKS